MGKRKEKWDQQRLKRKQKKEEMEKGEKGKRKGLPKEGRTV